MKDRLLTDAFVYIIYLSFALIALRVLIIRPGVIGMQNDWGLPPYSEQLARQLTDPFYVWYQEDLGHPIFLQGGAIIGGLFGIFGYLGMNGELFSKLLVSVLFPFMGFNMYLLFRKLSKTFLSQFIAGLFYEFNPFVYNAFSIGSILELVAYTLAPLVILLFIEAIKDDHLDHHYALITALLFVLAGAVLQYTVMVFILLLVFSMLRLNRKNLMKIILFLFLIVVVWLALNTWWILPFYGTIGYQEETVSNIASSIFVTHIAPLSPILDVVRLAGAPNFFTSGLLLSPVAYLSLFQLTSIAIVLVAFSTLLFKKNKITLTFAFIAAITPIFISGGAFAWVYENFFLAKLFRNSFHLLFLVAFSYSVLLGIASESYLASIKGSSKRLSNIHHNFSLKKVKRICKHGNRTMFAFIIIILVLINSSPFFLENISNTVHNFNLPPEYKNTYDWLSRQSGQFRIIWQPDVTTIIYKPAVEGLSGFYAGGGVDTYIGYSPKPTYGNYLSSDFSQFVEVSLHQAPTKDLAYLLSSINAKYVIIRQDYETLAPTWGYMGRYPGLQEQWNNEYIINKLTNQNGIVFYERTGNITILENKLITPWITSVAPENTFVILGDANAFFVLPTLPNFPANNSMLIFPSQYSSEKQLPSFGSNIVILDYDVFDLVQAYIPLKYKIEPGLYAEGIDASANWVSLSHNQIYTWWWYNYRYTASLEAAALTLTKANLTIPYNVTEAGTYDLWSKVFFGPKSTALILYIDGKEETTVNLSSTEREGFFWEHLTRLNLTQGRHIVTINSNKGENVVAKMVIAPQYVLNSAIKNATSFLDNRTILVVDQNWNSNLLSVPDSSINIFQNIVEKVQNTRIIYFLNYPPQVSARYYSGWKGVISTNGQGDPEMLIFPSPDECPYIDAFPPASPSGWNACNSTLIYITTGPSPFVINSVLADGIKVSATAWWETDTSWRTGWPITIPPNQRAIIQVNQQANTITLQTDRGAITLRVTDGRTNPPVIKAPSTDIFIPKAGNYLLAVKVATGYGYGSLLTKIDDQNFIIDLNSQEQGPIFTYKYIGPINLTTGYHQISTSRVNVTIPVYDGWTNPINWTSTFTNQPYVARYYTGWKAVIRTDGSEPWDTLSFPSLDQCPYIFPPASPSGWNACNSTLIYITTHDKPLRIDGIQTDGKTASDLGVWWETDWMGMTTKPVTFPIIIPPNQKAIIQINHKADDVTLETNPPQIESMLLYSLKNGENFADANNLLSSNQTGKASITYEKINPTKYIVHINASKPFFLVFSESYHKDWIAYVDGQQVPNEYHFIANGFANGWYINKTGTYTITLEFWPQRLFYIGSTISITTLTLCVLYIGKNKIKTIYKRCVNKISNKLRSERLNRG
jgi:hypothetical protein